MFHRNAARKAARHAGNSRLARIGRQIEEAWQRGRGQNAQDHDHDHQFDQGKAGLSAALQAFHLMHFHAFLSIIYNKPGLPLFFQRQ
jgi:hypothetical protein